jgi:NTE family protein
MTKQKLTLHLALQGGGAHGAFTWGALDRLLDEPSIEFGAISGCSAGALNGAALVTGWVRDGRQGARAQLALLWQKAAEVSALASLMMLPLRKPSLGHWDDMVPLLPPAIANPLGIQPLRYVLDQVIDEQALRSPGAPALFVNAIRVRDGATRVFGPADISIEGLLASACAPQLFTAVEIEQEHYWDGSYTANPVLRPLYENRRQADVFLIELSPLQRQELPLSAKNILNRINEITGTAGLRHEIGLFEQARRSEKGLRFHVLSIPEDSGGPLLDPSIKRSADAVLFEALRQEGRRCCDKWLHENRGNLGVRSSVDPASRYLQAFQPRNTACPE